MEVRIPLEDVSAVMQAALGHGIISGSNASAVFYDMDRLARRCVEACQAFGDHSLNAIAIKANPLPAVLRFARDAHPRMGAEAASLPELHLALDAGFEPQRIVFDSPVKTVEEIRFALEKGVHLNIDNFQELTRVAGAVGEMRKQPAGSIGFRVNPQVGAGTIASTSVAAGFSKFGVPLHECKNELLAAFEKYPWLTGVHSHIGSQGCSLAQLVEGAQAVASFALQASGVEVVDIGGGLPATYDASDAKPTIGGYALQLRREVPELFSGRFRLFTEFGRAINANAAFAATRVEYVKEHSGVRTLVTHLGADMFLRKCYNPADWHHDMAVLDSGGAPAKAEAVAQSVAGPLCFQGDFIARDVFLPAASQGDWVVVRDVGAYTFGMWSRYNSRTMPVVLGFTRGDKGFEFSVLRRREGVGDVLDFWE